MNDVEKERLRANIKALGKNVKAMAESHSKPTKIKKSYSLGRTNIRPPRF